jgi:hypothetical protein
MEWKKRNQVSTKYYNKCLHKILPFLVEVDPSYVDVGAFLEVASVPS